MNTFDCRVAVLSLFLVLAGCQDTTKKPSVNAIHTPEAACGSPATLVHTIQGDNVSTPMVTQVVTIEAVVVGDFQSTTVGLSGFFVQEELADIDNDSATSEGLFINDNGFDVGVKCGDVARVSGTVTEYKGLAELTKITAVEVCHSGVDLPTASISLPFKNKTDLERYEGMLVQFSQTLTVTENYQLGRYGEIVVSSGGRLFIPTNIVNPGATAIAQQELNDLNRLVIDDGSAMENQDPISYPAPGLTALNTLRNGYTVADIIGVMSYGANTYRVHPVKPLLFVASTPRNIALTIAGTGSLRVASFNVLNYFNGDGQGGGFTAARGADSMTEFTRQRDKIIIAISQMQADIIGLMEIENDGYGPNSAIQDLVNGLNAVSPAGTSYQFIKPGVSVIGTDAIAVGLLYRIETVQPMGQSAILDSSVDSRFNDQKNRPMLTQTFLEKSSGGQLTIAVNHLKSKGSSCVSSGDPDTGDGQGNCNQTRTLAAQAIAEWLVADPTASSDSDVLIMGDLNAYTKEDPIKAFESAKYTNLITSHIGNGAYSYNYKGQSGNLDYALTSASLLSQVTGVTIWHINADEPRILDYNEEYKTKNQLTKLYHQDAFRASDHDPVVVEFMLTP